MRFLELIQVAVRLMKLWPLPDWTDSPVVRTWFVELLDVLDYLAAKTETTFDDEAIEAARKLIADEANWAAFYGLIYDLVFGEVDVAPLPTDPRVCAVADKAEMDPATLIMLITAAIELIKLWRERRR
jgi:hypothetical protein